MVFSAPGKINLSLDILSRRPDGYHEVDMIMQTISLADEMSIEEHSGAGIELVVENSLLSAGKDNLVYQAADLIKKQFPNTPGIRICLKKNIPMEAGLAGGSSDGAAVLRGLNQIWDLGLSLQELQRLGAQLGSDVPFCIRGGTARATGRGERIEQLPNCPPFYLLLVKPDIGVATPIAYQGFQNYHGTYRPALDKVLLGIKKEDKNVIRQNVGNLFEEWIPKIYPEVGAILQVLRENSDGGVCMSGSGPTVFALTDRKEDAQKLSSVVEKLGKVWICQTLSEIE